MKVVHLSFSDGGGGGARAAFRIHRALVRHGVDSLMRVGLKTGDDWRVTEGRGLRGRAATRARTWVAEAIARGMGRSGRGASVGVLPSRLDRELSGSGADALHLHWVSAELLSVEAIGRLRPPVVWTLHDMWPFCGAEHYAEDGPDARFRAGYLRSNRPPGTGGFDTDRWVWRRKFRAWRRPMTIVAPSVWMADCARGSALFRDWPVHVIPYPVDGEVWKPMEPAAARALFGLPPDRRLVLFGALSGLRDPRKGGAQLAAALRQMASSGGAAGTQLVVAGQCEPPQPVDFGVPVRYLGPLGDAYSLAAAYSAADVFVLPSLQDNLPNAGIEAHACACPVVAFRVGGIPDIVEHERTGYLAPAGDCGLLARGIRWVLEDAARRRAMGAAARDRALRLWSQDAVAAQYAEVYRAASRQCPGGAR